MDIVVKNYNKLLDNKHKLDIISLSDFLFKRGDKLLKEEFIDDKFLRPEDITKEEFQTLYKWFFNFDIQSGLSFVGDDFPADYYNEKIIKYILRNFDGQFQYKDLMKFFNSDLLKTFRFNAMLIERNPYYLKFISKDMKNYYGLVKVAFKKYSYLLLGEKWFPREYIPQLIKDFPEDVEALEYYLLKEHISKQVRKLLKEEFTNVTLLEYINDKHKIDIDSLNNFFIEKGDNYLDYILFENKIFDFDNLNEDKIREFILKGYTPLSAFSYYLNEGDIELKEYVNLLLHFEDIKYTQEDLDFSFSSVKLRANKYISIEGLLKYDILFIKYIPEDLLTQEMCNYVYKVKPSIFEYIPDKFKTYEMCKDVLLKYYLYYIFLPDPSEDGTQISSEECYSLLREVYVRHNPNQFWAYASNAKIDQQYFIRLMNEFNAQEYVGRHGQGGVKKNSSLKEHISKQVRKLLRETIYNKGNF